MYNILIYSRAHFRASELVKWQSERLVAIARWIGTASELASAFPAADAAGESKTRSLRDSTGLRPKPRVPSTVGVARGVKQKCSGVGAKVTGDLSGCPRWERLRQRIRDRVSSAPP